MLRELWREKVWACVHLEDPHYAACGLQQLHQQIMDHHGEKFVAAAQAADAVSSNAAEGGASALAGAASNVMDLIMRLSNTKARAMAASKIALEAEQGSDALEREVQALERAMKRPQTEASSTKNAEGMEVDEDMWDLGHHQWEATRVRNLHNIEFGSVVSECVFVYIGLVSSQKKMCKNIIISPEKKIAKKIMWRSAAKADDSDSEVRAKTGIWRSKKAVYVYINKTETARRETPKNRADALRQSTGRVV